MVMSYGFLWDYLGGKTITYSNHAARLKANDSDSDSSNLAWKSILTSNTTIVCSNIQYPKIETG